jgi:tRNA dimethylallyltransferase
VSGGERSELLTSPAAEPGSAAAAPPLLAVVGPTATGKTRLAVRLAERLGWCELLSADSRQVLRGLTVGTGAPTPAELRGVPCHLVGVAEPGQPFTVADWLAAARRCLDELGRRGARPIVVGGTGLYVRALLQGYALEGAAPDPVRRASLDREAATPAGLSRLSERLRRLDPAGAAAIDLRNPRRVVRALELVERHGSLAARPAARPAPTATVIGLDAEPPLHRVWIAERVRAMLGGGLVEETAAALAGGVPAAVLDASGIGYREALALLDGRLDREGAEREMVSRTIRYARAQRTWFRAEPGVGWLRRRGDSDLDEIVEAALGMARAT